MLLVLAAQNQTTVNAQMSNSENFLTYQDPIDGFKISYPSSWKVTPIPGNSPNFVSGVEITSPLETFDAAYSCCHVRVVATNLPSETRSLEELTEFKLGLQPRGLTETIVESGNANISGLPAYKIVKIGQDVLDSVQTLAGNIRSNSSNTSGLFFSHKTMEIWTIHGNKWYDVIYEVNYEAPGNYHCADFQHEEECTYTGDEEYRTYLPLVLQVMNTLEIS